MVVVRAELLDGHARQTSQQASERTFQVFGDAGTEDPPAVLADPDDVVLKPIYTMPRDVSFHLMSVPPAGSFNPD